MGRHGKVLGRLARDALSILRRMFIICFPKSIGKRFPRTSPESFHPPPKIPALPGTTFTANRRLYAIKKIDSGISFHGNRPRRLPDGEQRTGGDSARRSGRLGSME